jgi:hypothetical protein
VLGKRGGSWWFFDGENVVECVVNVVGKLRFCRPEKWDRFSDFIFWGLGGERTGNGNSEMRGSFASLQDDD